MHITIFLFTEGMSLNQFSAVTQLVMSVMNLSDMVRQDTDDSSVQVFVEAQQNR